MKERHSNYAEINQFDVTELAVYYRPFVPPPPSPPPPKSILKYRTENAQPLCQETMAAVTQNYMALDARG